MQLGKLPTFWWPSSEHRLGVTPVHQSDCGQTTGQWAVEVAGQREGSVVTSLLLRYECSCLHVRYEVSGLSIVIHFLQEECEASVAAYN